MTEASILMPSQMLKVCASLHLLLWCVFVLPLSKLEQSNSARNGTLSANSRGIDGKYLPTSEIRLLEPGAFDLGKRLCGLGFCDFQRVAELLESLTFAIQFYEYDVFSVCII